MPIFHPEPARIAAHRSAAREVLASLRTLPAEAHLFLDLGIPDGEAGEERALDFLVVHPELGVVIVAVLGAGVERVEGQWVRRQADGAALPLEEEPGATLARQHYLLLHFLKQAGLAAIPAITRVLALPALPMKPGQALGPELPACRILTREKLRQPFLALREAVSGGRPWDNWRALDQATHPTLAPEPFQALLEALAPRLMPSPTLGELMAPEGELEDAESQHLLDHLAHNFSQGRYRLRGAPGSGKSLLGRKVARLWAAEGRRVLVLAASKVLALASRIALEDLVSSRQARVATYQDLAVQLLEDARALPPAYARTDLPALLARNLPAIRERWDALVLDEGQELAPEWIEPLLGLLRHPVADPLLVLEDPAVGRNAGAGPLPGQPWHLDLSLRHGAGIRRAALQAMPACGWPLPEPEAQESGQVMALQIRKSSPAAWRRDLAEVLDTLQGEGLEAAQVLVLAPHLVAALGLGGGQMLGPWQINASAEWWTGAPEHVRIGTVQSFKGLEADAVVYLAPAYPHPDEARMRYAALSRARTRVIVLEQAMEEPLRPPEGFFHEPEAVALPGRFPAREVDRTAAAVLLKALRG